jgi:hypothetical protein
MIELITQPDSISAEWLTQALRQSGYLDSGKVIAIDYSIIGTGKMGDNARFTLRYAGDHEHAPDSVIAKFPATDEMTRSIAGARGAYYNEVMFYRHLAGRTSMRTPAIYANEISEDRMEFITVMEDMAPAEPGSQLVGESKEHAQVAMREAAKLAAAFYGDKTLGEYDYVMSAASDDGGALGQELLQQYWPGFLERFGHDLSEECIAFGDLYVANHCKFVTQDHGPRTLVHGDYRSENILFHEAQACTVDWQTISESSPLTDLAYFLGGSVEIEDRRNWERELVEDYDRTLAGLGVSLGFDECWKQYRAQAVHGLLITILGASFTEPEARSDAMFMAMIKRHLQHCVDLESSDFLV